VGGCGSCVGMLGVGGGWFGRGGACVGVVCRRCGCFVCGCCVLV